MNRKKQLFLDSIHDSPPSTQSKSTWNLLNWNVRNPSVTRAINQVKWIREVNPDVVLLTEAKSSRGTRYLSDRLQALQYNVHFEEPYVGGYGSLLASKYPFSINEMNPDIVEQFGSRVVPTKLSVTGQDIELIGVYVPNRRDEVKRRFLEYLLNYLGIFPIESLMFCGDLNVLEPDHIPHYSKFEDWEYGFYTSLEELGLVDAFRFLNSDQVEYSWVGRTGDEYRYDHIFVSEDLTCKVTLCKYLHKPRKDRLSDHSGMLIEFRI